MTVYKEASYREVMAAWKEELKTLANSIREEKALRRNKTLPLEERLDAAWEAEQLGEKFRVQHVAYCMVRGTPYRKIEPKTRLDRMPWNFHHAVTLVMRSKGYEEDVCFGEE